MRHEVETGHKQDHIGQKNPMSLQSYFTFCNERRANIPSCLTYCDALVKGVSLGEHKSEDDNENGRACTEPEKWPPSMGCRVDKAASKDRRQEISKGVSLLQHTGNNTSSGWGTILKCRSSCVTVKAAHCNTKEGSAGEKLLIGLSKASTLLKLARETMIVGWRNPTSSRTMLSRFISKLSHNLKVGDSTKARC